MVSCDSLFRPHRRMSPSKEMEVGQGQYSVGQGVNCIEIAA